MLSANESGLELGTSYFAKARSVKLSVPLRLRSGDESARLERDPDGTAESWPDLRHYSGFFSLDMLSPNRGTEHAFTFATCEFRDTNLKQPMAAFIKMIAHKSLCFLYDFTAHHMLYSYFISIADSLFLPLS